MQKGGTGLKQYTTTECGGCYQYQLWDGNIAYDIEISGEIIDGAFNFLLLFWQSLVFCVSCPPGEQNCRSFEIIVLKSLIF